jgi:hypothetical protein
MRRSPVLVLSFLVGAQPVAAGVLRGQVVDAHGNPVSDAAVHVMSAGGEAWTTRTAPSGRFFVSLAPGSYRVVVSSTDGTTDHDEVVVHHDSLEGAPDEVVVELATTATPSPATGFDSVDFSGRTTLDNFTLDEWEPIAPRLVAPPGSQPSSRLLARRDHLGLAALDARVDARRLRTTIGGGARLPESPGIPVEFLAEPSFVRAAPTVSGPSGLGGTAPLAIRFADQRRHGDARASLGPHGRVAAVAAEALEPGELAMTFGGVVERRPAADGAGGPSFVGQALWATELNVEQTRGHLIGLLGGSADGSEDYWGDAAITRHSDDGRRELTVGLTASQYEAGEAAASPARGERPLMGGRAAVVARFAGRIGAQARRGRHLLVLGGEVGGGHVDDAPATEVSAYVGDAWAHDRDLTVEVGLRWEQHSVGATQGTTWQPRAAVVWRPDADAGLAITATAERVARFLPHRGDLGPGSATVDQWTAQVSGGLWRHRLGWQLGVRARSPDVTRAVAPELGVDGSLELQVGTALAAQATMSTLERAATAQLATTVCIGTFAAIARRTPSAVGWGVAFERSLPGDRTLPLELGAELFDLDDPRQRSAQLTLRRSW